MAKQIQFKINEKQYTLEFTRKTIEIMEKQGFSIGDVTDKPISVLPQLFRGAFLAHHKFEKTEVIDGIFAKMTDREKLFSTLIEMYNEPVVALMAEPDENEGNVNWTAI